MSVARRRQMIEREHANLSITAQCRLVSISRSSFYYGPVPEKAETLALADQSRLQTLVHVKSLWG